MRQTLVSFAILSALSLPGIASAEVGPFDTENRVNPPGAAPKAGAPALKGFVFHNIDWVKTPRIQSPRDSASGLSTGRR